MSKLIPTQAQLEEFVSLLHQYRNACSRNSRAGEPDRFYLGEDRTSSAATIGRIVFRVLESIDFLEPLGWSPIVDRVFQEMRFCPVEYYQGAKFTSALERLDSQIATLETVLPAEDAALPGETAELAVANSATPIQCESERQIVETLQAVGHRLTTKKLLGEMSKRKLIPSESTVKKRSAEMVKIGRLTKDPKAKPPGYGLPEWGLGSSGS